ncbi:MAG: BolA/IbaG family iron-sulfur metabolism protein [Steroidobacteraceae bacterium]
MTPDEIATLIRHGLPDARVQVRSEDNVHFEALVVSGAFAGRRPLQRHQLVYQTLGGHMGGEIHALQLTTLTPDELAQQGQQ